MNANLLDLIDIGLSLNDDGLGPCVGDDETAVIESLVLGPCVGDDADEAPIKLLDLGRVSGTIRYNHQHRLNC